MFVKVCGLSTQRDVAAAVGAGADAVGFVLTPSPRQVDPRAARRLVAGIPPDVLSVAVFVDRPAGAVAQAATAAGVDAVQLHGRYSADDFRRLARRGLRVIRAATPGMTLRCGTLGEDLLIVDSPTPGSGRAWDWGVLQARPEGRWLLAGGLNPGNVAAAARRLRPWGVDVSSGVERARGIKDPGLIRAFVSAARTAEGLHVA